MAIRIKAAESAKEIRDVFKLRYQVYVEEEGLFPGVEGDTIVDLFDAVPSVVNLIAYDEESGKPAGTFRLNLQTDIRLPSDELFNFDDYRQRIKAEQERSGQLLPVFGSGGMLAIAKPWRKRRDVFRGLLKMACAVGVSLGITHIIATVNESTAKIYKNLGWEFLGDKIWIESIRSHILPVATEVTKMQHWAFRGLAEHQDLIERFSDRFEWLLSSAQSKVFSEGTEGNEAYLVASGLVKITQRGESSEEELSWTTLSRGCIFGEMSLVDDLPRSASAVAMANSELIVIGKKHYWDKLESDAEFMRVALKSLSLRLRDAGQRATLYAQSDEETRMTYCLQKLMADAIPLPKKPEIRISKTTISEFAFMSGVSDGKAEAFLNRQEEKNVLTFSEKEMKFLEGTDL